MNKTKQNQTNHSSKEGSDVPHYCLPHEENIINIISPIPFHKDASSASDTEPPERLSVKKKHDYHMLLALESGVYLQDWNEVAWARSQNYSYGAIARATGLDAACIKMHCLRHGIKAPGPKKNKAQNSMLVCCHYCGKLFTKNINREVTFCSSLCRNRYHNNLNRYRDSLSEDEFIDLIPAPLNGTPGKEAAQGAKEKDTPKSINKDWTSSPKRAMNGSKEAEAANQTKEANQAKAILIKTEKEQT